MDFNNWLLDLDVRFLEFQIGKILDESREQFWAHRNCILLDYEIHRLRKFNNPCQSCDLPLHLVNNYEIYGLGKVCRLCFDIHIADKHKIGNTY